MWPLLETLFSEVLTRDEWLRLFDSVFSNHPSFLLMACVAYITCCRRPLLHCTQRRDFEVTFPMTFGEQRLKIQSFLHKIFTGFFSFTFVSSQYFFHHRNTLDMGMMIKEAYRIMDSTPSDIHPRNMLSDFTPLPKGHYPVFNHYPEFIVEYQNREREKIRLQEMGHQCERCVGIENLLALLLCYFIIWMESCICLIRREVLAPHKDFVRGKAEEKTFYTQVCHMFLRVMFIQV